MKICCSAANILKIGIWVLKKILFVFEKYFFLARCCIALINVESPESRFLERDEDLEQRAGLASEKKL